MPRVGSRDLHAGLILISNYKFVLPINFQKYIKIPIKKSNLKIEKKNWYRDLTIKRDIKLFVNIFHLSSLHLLNDQVLISWEDRASLNSEQAMLLTTDSKML